MLFLFVLFALIVSQETLANQISICVQAFQSATHENINSVLTETYQAIWRDLGSSTEAQIALQKTTDPFVIPEAHRLSLNTLHDALQLFQGLVREKGLDLAETRSHLLKVLSKLNQGINQTAKRQEANQRKVAKPLLQAISWPTKVYSVAISPDGNWVIGVEKLSDFHKLPNSTKVFVYDKRNKRMTESKGTAHLGALLFAPDGSGVYFGASKVRLLKVPFKEGQLNWLKAIPHGTGRSDPPYVFSPLEVLFIGKDENFVVGTPEGSFHRLFNFNSQGEPKLLETGEQGSNVIHWQGIDSTNQLFASFYDWEGDGAKNFRSTLKEFKIGGERTDLVDRWHLPESLYGQYFDVTPEKLFIFQSAHQLSVWDWKAKKARFTVSVEAQILPENSDWKITQAFSTLKLNTLFVLVPDKPNSSIQAFNLSTGSPLGKFELPEGSWNWRFNQNSSTLITMESSNSTPLDRYTTNSSLIDFDALAEWLAN